ncbi:MAG: riboflavin synthase [Planctomycetota bacterium]|nr:riboflavin synthase [Planctomycetota bacterium]
MFTGLVECVGHVTARVSEGAACRLEIAAPHMLPTTEDPRGVRLGDSIAINGCCLTVVAQDQERLEFQAGTETLRCTNLGSLGASDVVNLERSLRLNDRLGGHFVTGHIDGVGRVTSRIDDDKWSTFWIGVPSVLSRFLAPKGCIAVDGVSLTVVEVTGDQFSVALIPHTLQQTTLGGRCVGDAVNIETDLLAKYVLRADSIQTIQRDSSD